MAEKKQHSKIILDFLRESNYIEKEYSEEAFEDAVKAWEYMEKQSELTLMVILKTHKILLKRLDPVIAGKLRSCDVSVGGKTKRYIGVSDIVNRLSRLFNMIPLEPCPEKKFNEKYAKEAHVMFEDIHPFRDGNGRVGRIIYNWNRQKLGLPIHVIHEGAEQSEYYKWFK